MSGYEVKVIKPGYTRWIGPAELRADGTITLIKGPKNVIVDTGGPWDREALLAGLANEEIKPEDVSFVVCTHGHSDHTGNNNLFPNATLIFSHDVCHGDLYTLHDFASGKPYEIDSGVEVVATPGHTRCDVSVIVQTDRGMVAVVGDLFESEADLADESLWRAFSELPKEQEASRKRILDIADFIVPGHGDMFGVAGDE